MNSRNRRALAAVAVLLLVLAGMIISSRKREQRAVETAVRTGSFGIGRFPGARLSALDVRFVPLQTTIEPVPFRGTNGSGTTLILPVQLENHSTQTIRARISHEWHGGEWPPTDLLVYLPQSRAIAPVYLAGESGSSAGPTILAPGQTVRLDLRLNWRGTGSVRGGPILSDDRSGDYQLRLVLMLGEDKKSYIKSYIVGPKMRVRVAVDGP